MRLIDADHLKWNVGGIKCGTITVGHLMHVIDREEPTVKMIPDEFVPTWFIEHQIFEMGMSNNSATRINAILLRSLLKDWKKFIAAGGSQSEPFVECKDCKYFESKQVGIMGFDAYDIEEKCTKFNHEAHPYNYCAWGESEDDQTD